ncbi:hypothetical protein HUJ05_011175 [Dendroctonus ponderosae]|nr:hypothetical protein HUJ05_011175 [Dendroctonus ponderosae]
MLMANVTASECQGGPSQIKGGHCTGFWVGAAPAGASPVNNESSLLEDANVDGMANAPTSADAFGPIRALPTENRCFSYPFLALTAISRRLAKEKSLSANF